MNLPEDKRTRVVELVESHSEGDVTIRQISILTGLSSEDAYNLVEEIYEEHDLGPGNDTPVTYTPRDIDDDNERRDELPGE